MHTVPPRSLATGLPVWGAALAVAASCGAAAQGIDLAAAQPTTAVGTLEFSGERIPRLDEPTPANRVEAIGWSQRGGQAFGVSFGATFDPSSARPFNASARSSLGVGLRWRSDLGSSQRLDVATWRSLNDDADNAGVLTTRIEMQFTSPQRALVERGALGLQLSSDSKLAMRLRKGGPMVYYRSRF
jgi:hypothetical protein